MKEMFLLKMGNKVSSVTDREDPSRSVMLCSSGDDHRTSGSRWSLSPDQPQGSMVNARNIENLGAAAWSNSKKGEFPKPAGRCVSTPRCCDIAREITCPQGLLLEDLVIFCSMVRSRLN